MTRSITFIFYYFTTLIALSVASCPKNGILDAEEGSCLFAVKFEDTFQNAQDYCSNYYGNLISIQSDDANEKVLSLGKTFANNTKFAWLGGKYDGTKITWIDETPAEFSNLQEGVPAGYLLLNLTSGKWTTANWNGLFPFVCRTQDASTEPPSCPPYAPCPTDWVYSQSLKFCYKAIFNVDFTEGDQNCRLMNSFLTSIHSDAENRFVNDLGKTGSPQTAWPQEPLIGGKRTGPGKTDWMWVDGTPFNYSIWADDQPDNYAGNEWCSQTAADLYPNAYPKSEQYLYKWNDLPCETRYRVAICKQPAKY